MPKTGLRREVVEGPIAASEFLVSDESGNAIPIAQVTLAGNLAAPEDNKPGSGEHLVRVKWLKTVPASQAIREKGFFGNQNSAAKPRAKRWLHTVERLKKRFEIGD